MTANDNGGNSQATLSVEGATWTGPGSNTIPIANTLWATTSGGTGTALTASYVGTAITLPAPNTVVTLTSANVFFGLTIPGGTAPGSYTQLITLEATCGSQTPTNAITANVIVQGICFIGLSTNSITFGTLYPTNTYNTNIQVTDNDVGGNAAANVLVAAPSGSGATMGYWTGPGTNTIPVQYTLYNPTSLGSYAGNAITNSIGSALTNTIVVPAPTTSQQTTSANVFFGLQVPGGTAGGAYVQNIIIENQC